MTSADVLTGSARWSVEASDALEWLRRLPDDSISLTLFSPPYASARTYGIGFNLRGQDWVNWLRPIVVEACRAVLAVAFAEHKPERMQARVIDGNEASARVLAKLGFREEGTLRKFLFRREKQEDVRIFSLLREEWEALHPGERGA